MSTDYLAFSADQVCELANITKRRLVYLADTNLIEPSWVVDRQRIYSFRDLVGVRVLSQLRSDGVSLQKLRSVFPWLKKHSDSPWASLRIHVFRGEIYLQDRQSGQLESQDGQTLLRLIKLEEVADETERIARKFRARRTEQIGRFSKARSIKRNAAVVAGTRIPTSAIWEFHQAGYSVDAIRTEYPSLTLADIEAAIEHEGHSRAEVAS